ncbi:Type I restriction-modification system, specificity subunit S [Bacillus thermotolerans]|uniref:Type I restriction-modification system, specificity subunit S n=2 Tax=Bacillus thermotolerans TaxID=1221996 RepID=A0A0F5HM91_BACTR|nr:Type I restriction-modification system, specificity subunit S [Bacillus thermotolerans]
METEIKTARDGYKVTELGEIPIEWDIATLGEVLKIGYGKNQRNVEVEKSDIPILGTGGIIGWSRTPLFEKPSVLIGRKGTIDKPMYIEKPFWTIDTLFYTDINIEKAIPKFIYYLFQTINWYKYNEATGVPSLSATNISKIKYSLPPISEQQKIAEILSTVDEQIENTDQLIAKTKELKKGLMQQLLTKGIGHTKFKETDVGEIPQDWEIVPFKSVCSIVKGQVDPNEEPYKYLPHIGNANVEKFTGRLLSYNLAYEDNLISGKYLFNENHVLYGKINPHFSKVAFPKFEGLCSADMYPIECKGSLDPLFLKYILLEKRFTKQMISASARTGIPKVNREELERFRFILPPFKEQQKIAEILSTVDDQIESYEQEKEKYVELKKGLMQQLLTGKIRVTV